MKKCVDPYRNILVTEWLIKTGEIVSQSMLYGMRPAQWKTGGWKRGRPK